ncbi:MAG: helix-turn-helix domain-containing protein [Chloroflexi bacterium]|nr:helix-turn-helix domain-containing protein [Chloroflexota bacterium]
MERFDYGTPDPAHASSSLEAGQRLLLDVLEVVDGPDGRPAFYIQLESLEATRPPTAAPAVQALFPPSERSRVALEALPARELVSATCGLEHDRGQQLFFLQGQLVVLSHQEYQLLVFFVDHPNQLLSHQQILAAVWQEAYELDFGVLHSSLYRLKQALAPFGSRLIQNQRGAGYRFVPEPRTL